jgi:16S rRNA (uracil1498-N3)-methyltransferase
MRLTRCFVDLPLRPGADITLPEDVAGHLVRVLRLREGETCVVFNGDGHDVPATLTRADKREVRARLGTPAPVARESPLRIGLIQGIARGEKMDLILQKATELGVAHVQPVNADRTEVRLEGERLAKRQAHWRSVMVSACEQSGRAQVPTLGAVATLAMLSAQLPAGGLRLMLDPEGPEALSTLRPEPQAPVLVAIGPEGGWSDRDRAQLRELSFRGLRLGPRILRTETAGLAAIAALQALYGDL